MRASSVACVFVVSVGACDGKSDDFDEKYNPRDIVCVNHHGGTNFGTAPQYSVNDTTRVRALAYNDDDDEKAVDVDVDVDGARPCNRALLRELLESSRVANLLRRCGIKRLICKPSGGTLVVP